MAFTVRVEEEFVCVVCRHVDEGQDVVPGIPLLDITTPDGMTKTIYSEGWGVVANIEGQRPFSSTLVPFYAHNDGFKAAGNDNTVLEGGNSTAFYNPENAFMTGTVFKRDEAICHIAGHNNSLNGRDGKLHPRPGPSVRLRRTLGISPG